jgi:phosphate transport system substrate-binding protein
MKKRNYYAVISFVLFTVSCGIIKPSPVDDSIYKYDYMPYAEKTKAVILPEKSTLKINDNLPILDGATALYPIYAAFVQAVYSEREYHLNRFDYELNENRPIVACSGTQWAFNDLISGRVDMIFCAKPSPEQIEKARENNTTFKLIPIGKEAFVFFVNKRNRVSNLSSEQIISIYSGRITNWNELGGKNKEIKIYQRPKNSGSQTILESIMGSEKIIEPLTENVLTFMLDIVNETAAYRNYNNAIGYSFLFYTTQMVMNNKIKLLSINNIMPTIETIQDNSYPYSDEFYAITTETKNENIDRFIEWILSEQGQYLIKKTGYVPIK